ncbi:saccharopine dehydrogenase, partial [Psychrobacter sp. AOP31-E1-50]
MRVKAAKGGLSGGTIASMATIFEEAGKSKARREQVANPYLLNNDTDAPRVRQDNISKPEYDNEHKRWLAPFVMASINTRIVHHSNQLIG